MGGKIMDNSAIVLIQCRYDSNRVPGKILKKLGDFTCLEYIVFRMSKCNYNVMIATSNRIEDNPISDEYVRLSKKYKYLKGIYRGEYEDVAKRLYNASEGYKYIIRITGDDIFADPFLINDAMKLMKLSEGSDSYIYPKDLIRGFDFDIISRNTLGKIIEENNTDKIESIEFLLKKGKYQSSIYSVNETVARNDINLSFDTEDDYKLIKIVFDKLYSINKYFTAFDVVLFIDNNKYLLDINKLPRLTVYTVFKDFPVSWLKEAISSLNKQSYTDYEYILVDYGSQQIHQFFKNVVNEHKVITYMLDDYNFVDAVKFAISKARGKYIMRLDADDALCDDNAIGNMIKFLDEFHYYSVAIPDYYEINEDGDLIGSKNGSSTDLPTCAVMEKRIYQYVKFLDGQQFRDGTSLIKAINDYGFKIGYIKENLFYYRIHEKSLTHSIDSKEKMKEMDDKINGR
jgi:spore coat polysaccharide biosynthesis protein SpsF